MYYTDLFCCEQEC